MLDEESARDKAQSEWQQQQKQVHEAEKQNSQLLARIDQIRTRKAGLEKEVSEINRQQTELKEELSATTARRNSDLENINRFEDRTPEINGKQRCHFALNCKPTGNPLQNSREQQHQNTDEIAIIAIDGEFNAA